MPGPLQGFTQGFQQSFGQGQNRRFLNKQAEEEFLRRKELVEMQSRFQNEALTPEEKLARAFGDPGFRQNFQQLQQFNADPAGFKNRALGQADRGLGIQEFNAQTNRYNSGTTPQIKNFNFLQSTGALPPQNITFPLPGGGQLSAPNKDFTNQAQNFFGTTARQDPKVQQYEYFMGQNLGAFQQREGRPPSPEEFQRIQQDVQAQIFRSGLL